MELVAVVVVAVVDCAPLLLRLRRLLVFLLPALHSGNTHTEAICERREDTWEIYRSSFAWDRRMSGTGAGEDIIIRQLLIFALARGAIGR